LFISDDFRSGYAKNLFTVRTKRGEYVASKTISGFICGAFMLIAYLAGSILGGAISGLFFDLHGLNAGNLVMCMLAKIFLMLVFVSIFTLISVAAKQKAWLSICGSLGGGMLLFMMVSMITPLGSTAINAVLCAAGGALFAFGLGAFSNLILKKTSLV
ncbi:MAG: ABC transporter permease subunit, partial [Clostridia bacterium]|nr:ABC transporter permease subunit [Clostridia bacterium]